MLSMTMLIVLEPLPPALIGTEHDDDLLNAKRLHECT